ncbi:MAG: inositol monophosphatase family protein [Candidatus Saccharimonadales bacterium]
MELIREKRNEMEVSDLNDVISDLFRGYREKQLNLAGDISAIKKTDGSDVTALDVEIEKALQDRLSLVFPGLTVIGEETGYGEEALNEFGLIDPIDGTTSFINGVPTWTNMFAYIRNKDVLYSAIYNPKHDNMFHAIKNGGSYKNDKRLDLSTVQPSNVIYCKEALIEPLRAILGTRFDYQVPPSGGGHGLTMVAEGIVAARFQLWASGVAHDYAPGGLIVSEAGGCNIPIKDKKYTYGCNSFVACHPSLSELMEQNIERIKLLER